MKSILRFHWVNKKQQHLGKLLPAGGIIFVGVLLLISSSIPAFGFHKETALLKKYNTLEDLVHDIKNGKVDFKDFRNSDGIALAVMRDSEIYDKAGTAMQDCISLAGKIGNSLGDREIVHCFEDSNYYKNKYSSNTTVPDTRSVASSIGSGPTPDSRAGATGTFEDVKKNALIFELARTGKFTEEEANEFASKAIPPGKVDNTQGTPPSGGQPVASTSTGDVLTKNEGSTDDSSKNDNPEDYNDLNLLVDDIKNGKLNRNEISLTAFQKSGAYTTADSQIQDCIDLGGKIGHNLGDHEIVRCSENSNYFKDKYSR